MPVHVLLVEDNLADVELVREALANSELEHVLQVTSDYEEARAYVESIASGTTCPDILLLDLNLPKGSGFDLLQVFRIQPRCQNIPVIVVSSSDAQRDRDRAAELGAVRYFRKPTDLLEFMKLGSIVAESLNVA